MGEEGGQRGHPKTMGATNDKDSSLDSFAQIRDVSRGGRAVHLQFFPDEHNTNFWK